MNVDPLPGAMPLPDSAARRALHLIALCSFAVMQPLLDTIARNDAFLYEAEVRWPELAGLVLVLAFGVPAVAVALDQVILRVSARANGWGRDTLIFGLALLGALSLLRTVPPRSRWWSSAWCGRPAPLRR